MSDCANQDDKRIIGEFILHNYLCMICGKELGNREEDERTLCEKCSQAFAFIMSRWNKKV
jgi:ribosomal protein L37AE/L43A